VADIRLSNLRFNRCQLQGEVTDKSREQDREGPAFIFPTAANDALGQGKFQADPAAVWLYMGKYWVFGSLVQQRWSFAGDGTVF
jgi:hypothetical protein